MKVGKKIIIGKRCKLIIGLISLLLILVCSIFIFNGKEKNMDEPKEKVAVVIPKESPYTLDEIYQKVETSWVFDKNARRDYEEEAIEFAYVLFHFYDYFNEETELLVWDTVDSVTGEPLTFKKIDYQEYNERINIYLPILEDSLKEGVSNYFYVIDFRLFLLHDVKFV